MNLRLYAFYLLHINIVLFLCLSTFHLNAQSNFSQFNNASNIEIEDFDFGNNQRLFILDRNGKMYFSSGQNFKPVFIEKTFDQINHNNKLYAKEKDGKTYHINDKPFEPELVAIDVCEDHYDIMYQSSIFSMKDTVLISCEEKIGKPKFVKNVHANNSELYGWNENKIFIYKNKSWKTYNIPIQTMPSIRGFHHNNKKLLFHSNKQIYCFDQHNYDITKYTTPSKIEKSKLDSAGNIWYCDGTSLYRKGAFNNKGHLRLNSLIINGKKFKNLSNLALPNGSNDVTFAFDTRSLIPNKEFDPQFMIDGLHDSWQDLIESQVTYNLSPGKYNLLYRKNKSSIGHMSVLFEIKPKENLVWLYGLSLLTGFLFLLSFIQFITNRNRQKSLRQEIKLLRTKNQLHQTEQRLNQLKINPHFLFNSLNNIQGLIATDQPKLAKNQLRNFSLMMRQVLDLSELSTITIEQDAAFLNKYLELERMNHNKSFDYKVTIDNSCSGTEMVPPMTTQIAVENAIIHGIKSLKFQGFIDVIYSKNRNGLLQAIVKDNGKGLNAGKDMSQSKGIKFTRQKLGGRSDAYELANIYQENKVIGTKATLNFF